MNWTRLGGLAAVVVLIVVSALFVSSTQQTALTAAEETKKAGSASYSVVMTEGHNLLVTDNVANKLYFYTIDKDKPIGSPLKLRASVDLTKVGEAEIRITAHNIEKIDK